MAYAMEMGGLFIEDSCALEIYKFIKASSSSINTL